MARTKVPGQVEWQRVGPIALETALEEIRERGYRGYLPRAAARLAQYGVTRANLHQWLIKQPQWLDLRNEALGRISAAPAAAEAPSPLPSDHPDIRVLERRLQDKTDQVRELKRKLTEADRASSIVDALVETCRHEVKPFTTRPCRLTQKRGQRPADGVLELSDEHGDHVVSPEVTFGLEDYDFGIFRCRAYRLAKVLHHLTTVHLAGGYYLERLWVASLGDKQHGHIHDMKLRNHFANDVRAMLAIADAEADLYQKLLDVYPQVVVVGVPGNHPRTTTKPQHEDPHDNLDFAINAIIAMRLKKYIDEGRLEVHLPRSWVAFLDVRGWGISLNHGDDVRGWAGFPWYGYDRREGRVRALLQKHNARVHFHMYGHFHTPTERNSADTGGLHNGAFYMTGAYETKKLALGNNPRQEFFVFEDMEEDRGFTYKAPVYLRDRQAERAYRAGEWDPDIGRDTILDTVGMADAIAGELKLPIIRAG